MEEKILQRIKKLAEENNCDEAVLNFKKEKPLIIKGLKGFFVPEFLLYKKGKLMALVSIAGNLEEIEEIHKLTLFIDYTVKKNLLLYILYDPNKNSEKAILEKFEENNIKLCENIRLIGML